MFFCRFVFFWEWEVCCFFRDLILGLSLGGFFVLFVLLGVV